MNAPVWSFHPANLLTYVSLAAGICSVAAALQHSAAGAGAFLALAALADTFDGRFARLFTRSSELEALGVQLDSLSDAVAFGAAPVAAVAILLSAQAAGPWTPVWWLAAIGYAGCALTRLACYNVSHADDGRALCRSADACRRPCVVVGAADGPRNRRRVARRGRARCWDGGPVEDLEAGRCRIDALCALANRAAGRVSGAALTRRSA